MSAAVIFGEEGRGYIGGKCSGVKYPAFTSGDLSRCTRDPLLQAASTNKMLAFDNLMHTVRATHYYHRLHIVRSHRATDHVASA